jgi:hypothetical protein
MSRALCSLAHTPSPLTENELRFSPLLFSPRVKIYLHGNPSARVIGGIVTDHFPSILDSFPGRHLQSRHHEVKNKTILKTFLLAISD